MSIGSNIKDKRTQKGFTQKELGDRCGMADSAIRRYESDRGNPTIKTLQRIAEALVIDWTELVPEEELVSNPFSSLAKAANYLVSSPDDNASEQSDMDVQNLSTTERTIVGLLDKLNESGQQKAIERVEELTEIPKYQKQEPHD